jgi:hypothetical protein
MALCIRMAVGTTLTTMLQAFAQSGMIAQSALLQAEWWPVDPRPYLHRLYANLSLAPFIYYSDDDIRGWKARGQSRNAGLQISSFAVFDLLLNVYLNCTKFPKLKTIIILGHSGGGYFTQRYVLASPLPHWIDQTYASLQLMSGGNTYYSYFNLYRSVQALEAGNSPEKMSSNFTFFPCNNSICDGFDTWPFGVSSGGFPPYINQVTSVFGALSFWMSPNSTYTTFTVGSDDTAGKGSTCQLSLQGYSRLDKQRIWQSYVAFWNLNNTIGPVNFIEQVGFAHDDWQLATPLSQQIYFNNSYLVQPVKKCNSKGLASQANTSYYLGSLSLATCSELNNFLCGLL